MASQRMREQRPASLAGLEVQPRSRGRFAAAAPVLAPPSPVPATACSQGWEFGRIPIASPTRAALPTRGQPLDDSTRAFFEPRLGHDLGGVRVHADARSAQSARSLQASAYTMGQEIHFGEGKFRPHSQEGRNMLGHELIHAVQQRHLVPESGAAVARKDHSLEQNAKAVAEQRSPIEPAKEPMVLCQHEREAPQPFNPAVSQTPQLSLNGHTNASDQQIASGLLQAQLTVGPLMQPCYFGAPMTLQEISTMLREATPAMTDIQRWSLAIQVWLQKVSTTRQLPPLFNAPVQVPRPSPSAASATAAPGSTTGPRAQQGTAQASPTQQAATSGLPDMAAAGRGVAGGAGTSTPGNWQPSVGSQWLITISPRGSGSPVGTSMQSQSTLGESPQVVVQAARDTGSGAFSVVAGGQALTPNLIQSSIVQLQPFAQLLAGLAQVPGNYQVSMTVQASVGVQLTLVFSAITIQIAGGIQATATTGQPTQAAWALSAMAGPSHPQGGTNAQPIPNSRLYLGVGPPPPFPGQWHGAPERQLGGGMLFFGGNLPGFMQ